MKLYSDSDFLFLKEYYDIMFQDVVVKGVPPYVYTQIECTLTSNNFLKWILYKLRKFIIACLDSPFFLCINGHRKKCYRGQP